MFYLVEHTPSRYIIFDSLTKRMSNTSYQDIPTAILKFKQGYTWMTSTQPSRSIRVKDDSLLIDGSYSSPITAKAEKLHYFENQFPELFI